jgi:PAS domain S-box-containing protein
MVEGLNDGGERRAGRAPQGAPLELPDFTGIGLLAVRLESGTCVAANRALYRMAGAREARVLEQSWTRLIAPADQRRVARALERLAIGLHAPIDVHLQRPDGTLIPARIEANQVSGRLFEGLALLSITEVAGIGTHADSANGSAPTGDAFTSAFQRIAASLPGAVYQYLERADGTSSLLQAGPAFAEMLGVDAQRLQQDARHAWSHVLPKDAATVVASLRAAGHHGHAWSGEFRVQHTDGSLRWVHADARPERLAGGDVRWTGYLVDTTLQRFEEQALRDGERSLRFLFEHAYESIVLVDAASGEITDLNPAAEQLFGRTRLELLGASPTSLSAPQQATDEGSRHAIRRITRETLQTGAYEGRWDVQHVDGSIIPCDLRIIRLPISGRSLLRCTLIDVSEREQSRLTQHRLEQAIGSAAHGIAMMDAAGRLTYANPTFLTQWGLAPDLAQLAPRLVDLWTDPDAGTAALAEMRATGAWKGEVQRTDTERATRTFAVELSAVRHPDGSVFGGLVSVTDVTEARQLEQRVLRAQQLETVGRLAGGIAHDFNNLLTVITASLDVAQHHPASHDLHAELDDAVRAAESAARLARQLLTFSRQQVVAASPLDVNALVIRMAELLPRMLGDGITLRLQLAEGVGSALIDKSQAEQILLNLAVNARDAMTSGGTLTIATARRRLSAEEQSRLPEWTGDECVELYVSDTGVGMTRDVLDHMFEPFFTTKPVGRGTGLGLSVIHGIVSQLHGRIDVESQPGSGTAFRILLPALPLERQASRATKPAPAAATESAGPLLLVEDDDAIRPLIERLLTREGHQVVSYSNGSDAMRWLQDAPAPPRLLITDVMMPLMNGSELAERARALWPDLRVLFISGYTADVIATEVALGAAPLLAKPFGVSDLTRAVNTTLAH